MVFSNIEISDHHLNEGLEQEIYTEGTWPGISDNDNGPWETIDRNVAMQEFTSNSSLSMFD